MNAQRFKYSICLGVIALVLFACHSTKRLSKGPIPQRSVSDLFGALESHNLEFDWFSAKAKIKFVSPEESAKVTVNIRMKKDSIIWMNVKKLAVELSRLLITPDSVYIVYRMDNMFERSPFDEMVGFYGLNVSFAELQQLIIGNCIIPKEEFAFSETDSIYYFVYGEKGSFKLQYILDPYSMLLEKFVINDEISGEVQVHYRDYKNVNDSLQISHHREYVATGKEENATASVNFSSVEINVPKSIKFAIPEHYGEYR